MGMNESEPSSLDLVLAGYATGTLPPALHALIGAHLELSPVNRVFVRTLESALGHHVVDVAAPPAMVSRREARLDAIFSTAPVSPSPRKPCDAGVEPRALRHFLGQPMDSLAFRTILPGVQECRLPIMDEMAAMFYRIRPGRKLPQHSHEGFEVTLVLQGGFCDASGHFVRGDIAVADDHLDHTPVADPEEECLCFAVLDAPLRFTGPLGRWANAPLRLLEKLERKPGRSGH
jgi:putative transcriptional regulator